MYSCVTKDLALYKLRLKKTQGQIELTMTNSQQPKKPCSVQFDDNLNQVHEVESYKQYNVIKEEEDCCEMLCKVQ